MKRILALAGMLAVCLAGCGGDQEQPSSGRTTDSAERPREDFQTAPETFEQARTRARRAPGGDDYDFVHAHLSIPGPGPDDPRQSCTGEWASTPKGSCRGNFLGGSPPFNEESGETRWEMFGGREGEVPREARAIPTVADAGIEVTQATHSNVRIECYIRDRSRGDCYTDASQQGKPTGHPGGPLSLDAEFPSHGDTYVLLRGYCRKGDPRCTPH